MKERCSAFDGSQCRKTKNLTRTRITIVREPHFVAKLPKEAIVWLCPDHLKLGILERLLMMEEGR
jgi:hypothetical protein